MITVAVPDRPELRKALVPGDGAELIWVGTDEGTWQPAAPAELLVTVPGFGRDRTAALIARMPRLKAVQAITAGIDWVQSAVPDGVTLCDGQGVHDVGVAEWTVATLLALVRDFPAFVRWQDAGRWNGPAGSAVAGEVAGSTVLLVGYGAIGKAVEARLRPFGATVLRVARHAREGVHGAEELPRLLGQADAVILLLPMTAQTRGLVNDEFLNRMKRGAILVNAARGPIVDTAALLRALDSGWLGAAGLDVTDPQPLPEGHPLWTAQRVFITPHVGTKTTRLYQRFAALCAEQIARLARGEALLNVVHGDY